jgi:hypothetical protein
MTVHVGSPRACHNRLNSEAVPDSGPVGPFSSRGSHGLLGGQHSK